MTEKSTGILKFEKSETPKDRGDQRRQLVKTPYTFLASD